MLSMLKFALLILRFANAIIFAVSSVVSFVAVMTRLKLNVLKEI